MDLRCVITSFLAFADCEPGYVSVHIDRTTGNFANEEIAYIIPGLSNDISQKVDEYRFNTKYSSDSKDICLLPNTGYTLYLYDSYIMLLLIYSLATVMDGPLVLLLLTLTMACLSWTIYHSLLANTSLSLS